MDIDFEVLRGLPGTGPAPVQFAPPGWPTHSEGLVVQVSRLGTTAWIGNFQRALSSFDAVVPHPDGQDIVVIAGGEAYVVDPISQTLKARFGGTIVGVVVVQDLNLIVVSHQDIVFEAIGPEGTRWKTPRLSWDGFRDVKFTSHQIHGQAWRYDDTWHEFEVDLATGRCRGGSYDPFA